MLIMYHTTTPADPSPDVILSFKESTLADEDLSSTRGGSEGGVGAVAAGLYVICCSNCETGVPQFGQCFQSPPISCPQLRQYLSFTDGSPPFTDQNMIRHEGKISLPYPAYDEYTFSLHRSKKDNHGGLNNLQEKVGFSLFLLNR